MQGMANPYRSAQETGRPSGGPTLEALALDLEAGRRSSRDLVEECLDRIADPGGEGGRAFISVDVDGARRAADEMDTRRAAGAEPSPFAGIPLSIKDLFDIRGQVTRAGSRVLAAAAPAARDAPAVARLRNAGFVLIGRSNMTEFAYSGLGINPHFGTPLNPWQRDRKRVPGGSSSGGAVSISDGFAHGAIGTDTGGSCRIPAAFCGVVGFKPTASAIPIAGATPLAPSLDGVGMLARSVRCCASLYAVLSGDSHSVEKPSVKELRFAIPQNVALDSLDGPVAHAFDNALHSLSRAGARILNTPVEAFARAPVINANGGFPAAESYRWHRSFIDSSSEFYDPRVLRRILRGAGCTPEEYEEIVAERKVLIEAVERELANFDALLLPTAAIVAPTMSELSDDDAHEAANRLALRNAGLINLIDGCAISIPIHAPGAAPVGLMLACGKGVDTGLLSYAAEVESVLNEQRLT